MTDWFTDDDVERAALRIQERAPEGHSFNSEEADILARAALSAVKPNPWTPIENSPDHPMPVIFYSLTRTWTNGDGEVFSNFPDKPYRDERSDIGFWSGENWCWAGSGHFVWERNEDIGNPDLPTHYMPHPQPPEGE